MLWETASRAHLLRSLLRNERVVVELLWVGVEGETVRLEVDDRLAVARQRRFHETVCGDRQRELVYARLDIEGLCCLIRCRERDLAVRGREHDRPHLVLKQLEGGGRNTEGVRRRLRVLGVRARPEDDLVLVDGGSLTSLKLRREVIDNAEPGLVVKADDPIAGRWREARLADGADVVGLAEVVPGHNLNEVYLVAVCDDVLPTVYPEMLVCIEDELWRWTCQTVLAPQEIRILTFLLRLPPK